MRSHEWILLIAAIAAGIFLAYLDSLPSWDDAGIIAGSLFLLGAFVTFLVRRRPWLIALGVGLWVPLRGVVASGDVSLIVVLIFPFLGAYAGDFIRAGIHRAPPSA